MDCSYPNPNPNPTRFPHMSRFGGVPYGIQKMHSTSTYTGPGDGYRNCFSPRWPGRIPIKTWAGKTAEFWFASAQAAFAVHDRRGERAAKKELPDGGNKRAIMPVRVTLPCLFHQPGKKDREIQNQSYSTAKAGKEKTVSEGYAPRVSFRRKR